MNNPEYVKINDKLYKINTDFRIAIECDHIARDKTIGDIERGLAIIYKLFGEDGLNSKNQNKLIELGMKYISLGKKQSEIKDEDNNENSYHLDFIKCQGLISSSFKFDYKYDPYKLEYLHWYDFYNDLENLSNNEFGTCCILNRVNNLLNYDTKEIKDAKERTKINKFKEELKKKYCICEEKELTKEQEKSVSEFYKSIGIDL